MNTALPEVTEDEPMTNRQRLQVHLNSEACSNCHRLIDPIGLGFEQYDAIGSFQEKMSLRFRGDRYSDGNTTTIDLEVDTSAYIQGIENSAFSTPKELGRILAEIHPASKKLHHFFKDTANPSLYIAKSSCQTRDCISIDKIILRMSKNSLEPPHLAL